MASSYDNNEKGLPRAVRSLAPSFLKSLMRAFSRKQRTEAVEYTPEPRPPLSQNPSALAVPQTPSYALPPPPDGPLPVKDKLATFRRITGITSARDHVAGYRPAKNLGIYARVVQNESEALSAFKLSASIINGCLGLQLVVAAALTALGAGNGPHGLVTAFGAVNTVIAGFLTYLKGSGLPNRHKFYASSWSKVREYMEQREREFEREDCQLDVEEVVRKIEEMYEEVRQDVEANEPEAYTSTGQIKRSEGIAPGLPISDKRGEFGHMPHFASDSHAMPGARASAFGNNHMSHSFGGDWKSNLNGGRTAIPSGERFSGLEEKAHAFEGGGLSDMLGHYRKAEGNLASHLPDPEPFPEVDQRIQAAMEAGADKIRSAKHMEAKVEDALKSLVAGVERDGASQASQMRAGVASEIEEERRGAAKAVEESAEKLHEAGEQRLDAAKSMAARVEGALSLGMHELKRAAEEHR